jgi:hypothetical protein
VEHPTLYRTTPIDGLSIFYREAGPKDAPTPRYTCGCLVPEKAQTRHTRDVSLSRRAAPAGLSDKERSAYERESALLRAAFKPRRAAQ